MPQHYAVLLDPCSAAGGGGAPTPGARLLEQRPAADGFSRLQRAVAKVSRLGTNSRAKCSCLGRAPARGRTHLGESSPGIIISIRGGSARLRPAVAAAQPSSPTYSPRERSHNSSAGQHQSILPRQNRCRRCSGGPSGERPLPHTRTYRTCDGHNARTTGVRETNRCAWYPDGNWVQRMTASVGEHCGSAERHVETIASGKVPLYRRSDARRWARMFDMLSASR